MTASGKIFTLGYAGMSIENFIGTLESAGVGFLIDVRSSPFSARFGQYNKDTLPVALASARMRYLHLGRELGARSPQSSHYDGSGQVQFDRVRESELFKSGIKRLLAGLEQGHNLALMCAEKQAHTCHRALLVAEHLWSEHGIEAWHIEPGSAPIAHKELIERAGERLGMREDLFRSPQQSHADAVRLLAARHAYRNDNMVSANDHPGDSAGIENGMGF